MKNFNYTCRTVTGTLIKGSLEAENRTTALAALKQCDMVPISVTEGGSSTDKKFPHIPFLIKSGVGTILLLIIAAAIFYMSGRKEHKAFPEENGARTVVPREMPSSQIDTAIDVPVATSGALVASIEDAIDSPIITAKHLSTQQQAPKQNTLKARGIDPIRIFIVNPPKPEETNQPPAKPLFQNAAEQRLALYAQPGRDMPPPPDTLAEMEGQVITALANDITVYDDDSEETVKTKEAVALLKEELRQHLAAGGTVKEYFDIIAFRQSEEADLVKHSRALIAELAAAGQVKEAKEALDEANAYLSERGISPIKIPPKYRKQMDKEP